MIKFVMNLELIWLQKDNKFFRKKKCSIVHKKMMCYDYYKINEYIFYWKLV